MKHHRLIHTVPAVSSEESVPLGNGRIGLSAWVESDGILRFIISHTDSYSEWGRLSKLGTGYLHVRHPNLTEASRIHQTLDIAAGTFTITDDEELISVTLWVDAHHPCIRLSWTSDRPCEASAWVDLYRPVKRTLHEKQVGCWEYKEVFGFLGIDAPEEIPRVIEADQYVDTEDGSVMWYHRNPYSMAALDDEGRPVNLPDDPLLHRTYGGRMAAPGWKRTSVSTLELDRPQSSAELTLALLCERTSTIDVWQQRLHEIAEAIPPVSEALPAHHAWWRDVTERSFIELGGDEAARHTSRCYAFQRYLSVCAGRGEFPIRFNGSIFNVDWKVSHPDGKTESYDGDYRRWGSLYFQQNTRLLYWPMLRAGDFESMRAYFNLFVNSLEAARSRARTYANSEGGAYFLETLALWDNVEERVRPKTAKHLYTTGSLEMLMMGLDYMAFTDDTDFFVETLLPLAKPILQFYRDLSEDRDGPYKITGWATENYHEAVNGAPDIAGLFAVLSRLLAVGEGLLDRETREAWQAFLEILPPLATRDARDTIPILSDREELWGGMGVDTAGETASTDRPVKVLAPAAEMPRAAWNVESPELYPVFPFRLYGMGREGLVMARRTYRYRRFRHDRGWAQDAVFAAHLGLAEEAKEKVIRRYRLKHPAARFPVYWEASFDWVPDQDNGGVANTALQSMLLQYDDEKIYLLPAWPMDWDVEFKLHAPRQTTVHAKVTQGRVEIIDVTPASRRADLVVMAEEEDRQCDCGQDFPGAWQGGDALACPCDA